MKILITVLLIFTIIIGGGILQFVIIDNYMQELSEYIDMLEKSVEAEDVTLLEESLKLTDEKWSKMRNTLSLIINHEYIFEIDSAITELYGFVKVYDSAEAILAVSRAKAGASCIIETSALSFENII